MASVRDIVVDRGSAPSGSTRDRSATPPSRVAAACAVAFVCSALLLYFGFGFDPVRGLSWLVPLPALLLEPRC